MSMSLDGYIADPNDFLGGGDDHRLHEWFAPAGSSSSYPGRPGELMEHGEGRRRGPERARDWRVHGATGAQGWGAG
jgi:hypothetical protein